MSILAIFQTSNRVRRQLRAEADAARDSNNWQQAANLYKAYLQTVPDDAAIWVQLGHAHKEMGDLDIAERSYWRALSIEPDNPDTHVQMGHIEKLKGNLEQSLARYRKALDIEPSFEAALAECRRLEGASAMAEINTDKRRQPDKNTIDQQFDDVWERLEHLEGQGQTARAVASEIQRLQEKLNKIDERVEHLITQLSKITSDTTKHSI